MGKADRSPEPPRFTEPVVRSSSVPALISSRRRANVLFGCAADDSVSAPSTPKDKCEPCEGSCKEQWISLLNGTVFGA